MKILFIGGTGRLSTDVAKLSLKKGNEVYLLTRGSKDRKKFIDSKYKMLYADIRNVEECKKVLSDLFFDVVVDFLTFDKNQLLNTLSIIEKHYKQYIFISSATVYEKKNEKEIISEKTKIGNSKWEYAYKKYECEKEICDYFSNSNAYYTIVRPYVTYNETRIPYPIVPQDSKMEYSIIKRVVDGKAIPTINGGKINTTITNTKDFAVGIVGLFNNEKAYGESFHITSDEPVCWDDVLNIMGKYYQKEIKKVNFSVHDFSKKYPLYKEILEGDKGHEMRFNNDKIKNTVKGFSINISLEDGIKETLRFYEDNKEFQKVDYYWYGRIDKICKDTKEKLFPNSNEKLKYLCGYYSIPIIVYKILRKVGVIK